MVNNYLYLSFQNIAIRASDLLLGLEPWLNLSTTCTSPAPWENPRPNKIASQDVTYTWNITRVVSDFSGVFGNMGFGLIKVFVDNEKYLMLEYGRFGKMQLLPVTDEDFIGYYIDKLWFFTNSDGNINRVPIRFVSNKEKVVTGLLFPIDFQLNRTLFQKGSMFDSKMNSSQLPNLANTSVACVSGPTSTTGKISIDLTAFILCVYIDTFMNSIAVDNFC